jgi:hypothetical protein
MISTPLASDVDMFLFCFVTIFFCLFLSSRRLQEEMEIASKLVVALFEGV